MSLNRAGDDGTFPGFSVTGKGFHSATRLDDYRPNAKFPSLPFPLSFAAATQDGSRRWRPKVCLFTQFQIHSCRYCGLQKSCVNF
jgi:hypothetical protein